MQLLLFYAIVLADGLGRSWVLVVASHRRLRQGRGALKVAKNLSLRHFLRAGEKDGKRWLNEAVVLKRT